MENCAEKSGAVRLIFREYVLPLRALLCLECKTQAWERVI